MGFLLVLFSGGVSAAMISLFGYADWVIVASGLPWLVSLIVSVVGGHQGFGGHGNTDLQIVIAGLFITAAIILPNYTTHKHCDQAKTALTELANAEAEYFLKHQSYTSGLNLLSLTLNPNIEIRVINADEQSFTASASHRSCIKETNGTPEVFMWDSSRGELQ